MCECIYTLMCLFFLPISNQVWCNYLVNIYANNQLACKKLSNVLLTGLHHSRAVSIPLLLPLSSSILPLHLLPYVHQSYGQLYITRNIPNALYWYGIHVCGVLVSHHNLFVTRRHLLQLIAAAAYEAG